MKKSENYNLSQFESLIFEMMKLKKITIPKKASFWRVVIEDCFNVKSTTISLKI